MLSGTPDSNRTSRRCSPFLPCSPWTNRILQPMYSISKRRNATDDRLRQAGAHLEDLLGENFHYRYCRDLGQLSRLRVFRIAENGRESYLRRCTELGQRLGDVKPRSLHRLSGWTGAFSGRMLE